ncbi:MAG: hypothetical protein ACR2IH_04685 [Pyrinomonadaceae bacterium]
MSENKSPLDNIKIASPCSSDWNGMYGTDRKRFCGECNLNVYNLSGMTKSEAESMLIQTEGRLCVRYFKRADGTIITKDCPVGWAAVRKRLSMYATAAFSLVVCLFTGVLFASLFQRLQRGNTAEARATFRPVEPQWTTGSIAVAPRNDNTAVKAEMVGMPTLGMPIRPTTRKKR